MASLRVDQAGIHARSANRKREGQRLLAGRGIDNEWHNACGNGQRRIWSGAGNTVGCGRQKALIHHQLRDEAS